MIQPHKYMHPDKCVIYLAFLILRFLKKKRIVQFSTILAYTKKSFSRADFLFIYAIDFLYLLGVIEYYKDTDSFAYIDKNIHGANSVLSAVKSNL